MKAFLFFLCLFAATTSHGQVLGDPVDISQDFQRLENVYFVGSRVTAFDASTGQGGRDSALAQETRGHS